jgi:hypothetical protein
MAHSVTATTSSIAIPSPLPDLSDDCLSVPETRQRRGNDGTNRRANRDR